MSNTFGVDRLDETRRARLEALKGKRNRTALEDDELRALAMSGGHEDRAWLQQHGPLSRQAASMAGGQRSTGLTEADVRAAIEAGLAPVRQQLQALADQYGGDD